VLGALLPKQGRRTGRGGRGGGDGRGSGASAFGGVMVESAVGAAGAEAVQPILVAGASLVDGTELLFRVAELAVNALVARPARVQEGAALRHDGPMLLGRALRCRLPPLLFAVIEAALLHPLMALSRLEVIQARPRLVPRVQLEFL